MIHLDKPNETPPVLLNRGTVATQQDCEAYVGNPAAYGPGELKFNEKIYGSSEVRNALRTLQHDKCCYCESKHSATSAGRIDHFRPKGAVRQDKGSDKLHPGYYWLAYRWDNLVLACEKCNGEKILLLPARGSWTASSESPLPPRQGVAVAFESLRRDRAERAPYF